MYTFSSRRLEPFAAVTPPEGEIVTSPLARPKNDLMVSTRAVLCLALVAVAHAFRAPVGVARAPTPQPTVRPCVLAPHRPLAATAAAARSADAQMVGGFNGGFLNLGAPEVIVIGAVAWAVLGPKELFRLAKQAGEFIGQWQELGQQAKDTFTSALEQELAEDEAKKAPAPEQMNVAPPS